MPHAEESIALQRAEYVPVVGETLAGSVAAVSAPWVTAIPMGYPCTTTLLQLNALPVTTGNTTGISFGSKQLFTFRTGYINILDVNAYFRRITFNTEAGATGDIAGGGSGDYSLGSTATADGVLATTEVNLLPSSAMLDPFVAGVGTSASWTRLAAAVVYDGTSAALSVYLNVIIDDADVSDAASNDNVYFTGYVRLTTVYYGDRVTA